MGIRMGKYDWNARQQRLCGLMQEAGIDCLLQFPAVNMGYLTGRMLMQDERLNLYLLTADGKKAAFANTVYQTEVEEWDVADKCYWKDGEDPWKILKGFLAGQGYGRKKMMVDGSMPSRFTFPMMDAFPETAFVLANELYSRLRRRKDEEEYEAMKTSCQLCSEALEEVMAQGRGLIGMTEGQLRDILCRAMEKRGISNAGALVCAGENAAIPHYTRSDGKIEDGKCLLVDFGGTFDGYWSDMTRTFYFGAPPEDFRRAYEVVREALLLGHKEAYPGNRMKNVDKAVRGLIERRGYGAYFTHRTGHGIGLECHEQPCAAQGEMAVMEPGMAFSIEPGVYLPGKFGIRIEDQAFLTEDGVEILHPFPRELRVF